MIRKKIFMICSVVLLSISLSAQDIGSIMEKYGKVENVELVKINNFMLTMARAVADKESKQVLKKITGIKVLSADSTANVRSLMSDIDNATNRQNYEKVVEVREKGETVNIYFKELGKNKTELLVVNNEKSGTLNLILVSGSITPEEFEKLNNNEKNKDKNKDKNNK